MAVVHFSLCLHVHNQFASVLSAMQALSQAGAIVAQPSSTAVAVGIASAEYNNYIVPRFTAGVSAYSATGGALSVASGRLRWVAAARHRVYVSALVAHSTCCS